MKRKINVTLTIIAMFAVVTSTIAIIIVSYNLFENQVRNDVRVSAELLDDTGVFDRAYSSRNRKITVKDKYFKHLTNERLRITWIDRDGTVLFDNDTDATRLENHSNRPEFIDAMKEGNGQSIRTSDTFKMNTYYYAIRIDNGTVIRVSMEARTIASVFLASLPTIALIVLGIIIVCMIIAQILTKQIIAPIEKMAENLDNDSDVDVQTATYRELIPFANKIRSQHEKVLKSVKSRQDFTANVSHELKTPLAAISGYAELIENKMVEPDQEIYFAKQIHANADRLLSVINDIISLSELDHNEEVHNFEEVDLNKIVGECVDELVFNASQKKILLSYSGTQVNKMVDVNLIRELVMNLVQNAVRYNNEGGHVKVTVSDEKGNGVICVKDDGIGIPADSLERVFERFYRVDKSRSRERGGTGLGLAIVKHIVEIHNGRIEMESEIDKGTTIRIIL
ncbi:MAG: ATP-binding protein [Bacillota bacterium]|nr:ATP-binding protein [Bacillota bacterium]